MCDVWRLDQSASPRHSMSHSFPHPAHLSPLHSISRLDYISRLGCICGRRRLGYVCDMRRLDQSASPRHSMSHGFPHPAHLSPLCSISRLDYISRLGCICGRRRLGYMCDMRRLDQSASPRHSTNHSSPHPAHLSPLHSISRLAYVMRLGCIRGMGRLGYMCDMRRLDQSLHPRHSASHSPPPPSCAPSTPALL